MAFASSSRTLTAVVGHPHRHGMPLSRANPYLDPAIVLERFGPLAHQLLLLGLQGRGIQRPLEVMPDQQTAQAIGTLTNLAFQRLKLMWTRHQPRRLLHLSKLVEDLLYVPGVIAILTGQTRVTRHVAAPC